MIINRIGGKTPAAGWHYYVSTYYWLIVRTSALEVVILKTLRLKYCPLVGCFKNITQPVCARFSATIYLVCFCF
nr:MFS transporter [Klebsiella pneumoniae]